ncbi:MAG TPA: 50S ribosomal protein L7ae [Clostridiaceae bacterium]|nr:50S ribosomal protein L7ae [Clostridiaceae bacterium]
MTNNKIYSFLGLATKAGKVISGEEACERIIKAGKAKLVIVADDASDRTKRKFDNICKYNDVELKFFGEKEFLGKFIGKEARSVIAILSKEFAKRLGEMIEGINNEFGGEQIGKS